MENVSFVLTDFSLLHGVIYKCRIDEKHLYNNPANMGKMKGLLVKICDPNTDQWKYYVCDIILRNHSKLHIRQNQLTPPAYSHTTVLLVSSLNFSLVTQGWL